MAMNKQRHEYLIYDISALICGALLVALFLFSARFGVPSADESFYYTVAQRILNGDRLIVEEWNLSQFVYILDVVPYWAYSKISGGTEGIILFMRYFFIAVDASFFVFMYSKLRLFGWRGIVSSVLFCAIIPQTVFAVTYFTVSSMAFMSVCLILIVDRKKKNALTLVVTGLIMGVGIIAEPLLIVVIIIYIFAAVLSVVLKKFNPYFIRRYGFLLNKQTFLWVNAGALIVFIAFLCFLYFTGALSDIHVVMPYLFGGVEYNSDNFINLTKLYLCADFYGVVPSCLLAVCLVVAVVLRFIKQTKQARNLLFCVTCVACASCYIVALSKCREGLFSFYIAIWGPLPLLIASLIWYFCLGTKNPRLGALCAIGTLFSLIVDVSSEAVLGTGGMIAQIAGVYCFGEILNTMIVKKKITVACAPALDEKHTKKKRPRTELLKKAAGTVARGITVAFIVCFVLWHLVFCYIETLHTQIENNFSVFESEDSISEIYSETLDRGPFRGLRTTKHIAEIYNNTLFDMDIVKQNSTGLPFANVFLQPFTYLYLNDLTVGAFSAWYESEFERLTEYWKLFPNKKPEYLYFPFYDSFFYFERTNNIRFDIPRQEIAQLEEIADIETVFGRAGYLVRVIEWFI